MSADLHPGLEALAPLLGTWTGRGSGEYPTIEPFEYLEEVVFSHVGQPFLIYSQKTRTTTDGKPLHAETGYLRVPQPGHVELVVAHPTGVTEIEVGTYTLSGDVIELEMTASSIGLSPTAKEVSALGRSFCLEGDKLSYSLRMGAVGQPMLHHLSAVLLRQR
ncbi:peroxynitrite isomerase [Mycobacterium sp.]|uniref:peroxynitrite isomerase n=1 Tax=Mycobacterium sp. TaxID=1785 RepID=UPI001275ED4D|nr:FABP family protein [Mycobacterium sp.]KAA8960452.1 MAG: FABP family protein [Mycobacterium sp.]